MEDRVINNKFNIEAILRYAYPRELKHFKDEESLEILLNNIVEANRGNRPNCSKDTTYYNVRYINLNNSTLPSQIKRAFLDGMFLWRDEDSEKLKETLHLMKVFDLNELSKKLFEEIKNNKDNEICLLNIPIGYVATAALDVLGKETYMGSNEYILKMIRDFKNGTIKTE